MSKVSAKAPPDPTQVALNRLKVLKNKPNRTPAEISEMLDILTARVLYLESL